MKSDQLLKCKVVLVQSVLNSPPLYYNEDNKLCMAVFKELKHDDYEELYEVMAGQHMFLVSERKPKANDKIINRRFDKVYTWHDNLNLIPDQWYKIEASTDKKLGVPSIPLGFIIEYAEKQGNIEEVSLEVDNWLSGLETIRLGSNTVIIHHKKETWTRQEVKEVLQEFDAYASKEMGIAIPDGGSWFDGTFAI